jgi:hypothetical protein
MGRDGTGRDGTCEDRHRLTSEERGERREVESADAFRSESESAPGVMSAGTVRRAAIFLTHIDTLQIIHLITYCLNHMRNTPA